MIANGNASLHNLVMIVMEVLGPRYDYKGLRLALIAILDMVLNDIIIIDENNLLILILIFI